MKQKQVFKKMRTLLIVAMVLGLQQGKSQSSMTVDTENFDGSSITWMVKAYDCQVA